jgi:hypothetical protein
MYQWPTKLLVEYFLRGITGAVKDNRLVCLNPGRKAMSREGLYRRMDPNAEEEEVVPGDLYTSSP